MFSLPRPAVFLDRDGTLNEQIVREGKPFPPSQLQEFRLLPGVLDGCRALSHAGYALVVVTNQPDVGRGTQSQEVIEAMHQRLTELIPEIERVEVCYDPGRSERSRRRKPEPGMVLDSAEALGLDLTRSWMIGDRWRDVDCGRRAGLRTLFIDFGYDEVLRAPPDHVVPNFTEAVRIVLAHRWL